MAFFKLLRRLSPAKTIVLVFALIIFAGAALLSLPLSSAQKARTDFLTCLFTATSATCVTGLVRVDTGSYWSAFGKIVILLMIQIGGLGFMTMISIFFVALRRKIGLRQRVLVAQALSLQSLDSVGAMVKKIVLGTAVIEGCGAGLLTVRFLRDFPPLRAIAYGVFHSVSAFCNAGFDIFGDAALGGSIVRYQRDPFVNVVLMLLIVLGGLGFVVWSDVAQSKALSKLRVYTKLVLILTGVLIFGGAAVYLALEWNNPLTIGALPFGQKVLLCLFQSVTTRTAGFAAFPQEYLTGASLAFSDFLMLIGGSSGSTAGGLKTVTFFVIVLCAYSAIRGRKNVHVFKKTISHEQIMQAITLFLMMIGLAFFGALFLSGANGCSFSHAMFETVSALGTVGLSTGLTGQLGTASQILIILFMFFGRVGIMTISVGFLTGGAEEDRFSYAQTKLLIG